MLDVVCQDNVPYIPHQRPKCITGMFLFVLESCTCRRESLSLMHHTCLVGKDQRDLLFVVVVYMSIYDPSTKQHMRYSHCTQAT